MLIGFRKSTDRDVREEGAAYVADRFQGNRLWFDHEKLDVYRKALEFVTWCSRLRSDRDVPRSTITSLDKTSTGVALNIAEGNGKFSIKDRCRFIGHARTAALQAAATLDVLAIRQPKRTQDTAEGKGCLSAIVRMLVAWECRLQDKQRK
ncbi:MAG: four helix bundle protein [Candidatus Marinimicrobia bacterium]|nr:four helix bundle protein [Candidatus Neomarinimicrobiota bacterium]